MSTRFLRTAIFVAVVVPGGSSAAAFVPRSLQEAGSEGAKGNPSRPLLEAIREFEPHRKVIAPKLVRIEVAGATVHRNLAVGFERITENPIGVFPGIVIDALPILMAPDSLAEPKPVATLAGTKPPPPDDGKLALASLGMRYRLVREDGSRLPLVLVDRSRPLGLVFFALEDPTDPPLDLRDPLRIPSTPRRLNAGEDFSVTTFRDPVTDTIVVTVPGRLDPGRESYVRPALVRVAPAAVGSPLFSSTGEWLGIVNRTPSGEKQEKVRYEKPDVTEITPARDPSEWSFGHRWPILMSIVELGPEIERVRAHVARPQPLPAMGLELADRDGAAIVIGTIGADGAMFSIEPPLRSDDRILSLGGRTVSTVRGFERALEDATASTDGPLALEFERAGEKSTATLRFRG